MGPELVVGPRPRASCGASAGCGAIAGCRARAGCGSRVWSQSWL